MAGGGGGIAGAVHYAAGPSSVAPIALETRITPSAEKVYAALRKVADGKHFQKDMASNLDAVSKRGAVAVRNAARQIEVHGSKHPGLRERVANTITTKTRLSGAFGGRRSEVSVIADANRMADPRKRSLLRHLERGRWRHPVYGNTDKWVTQRTGGGYFYGVLYEFRHEWEAAIMEAMEKVAKEATRIT